MVRSGANHGKLQPLRDSDVTVRHVAHVQGESEAKRSLAALLARGVEPLQPVPRVFRRSQRRKTRAGRVTAAFLGPNDHFSRREDGQRRVAYKPQHLAAMIQNRPGRAVEEIVQDAEKRLARHGIRHSRRAPEITKPYHCMDVVSRPALDVTLENLLARAFPEVGLQELLGGSAYRMCL